MAQKITRRLFLQRIALGISTVTFEPQAAFKWLSDELPQGVFDARTRAATFSESLGQFKEFLGQNSASVSDEEIPTRFFYPGYTQDMLNEAWRNGALVNGFPWGLADTHTLGGIPDPRNVAVGQDGSAVLTIRRPLAKELADWQADSAIRTMLLEGEKNKLEMRLSVAAFTGRLPTDVQSVEASITLPQRVVTGDHTAGMIGTGWTLWTLPDVERLAANLANLGVPPEENLAVCSRVSHSELEEDIAEFGLGEPSAEWGDPLVLRIIGGGLLIFMAGRKTATQKCPRADIVHVLREPLDFAIPPQLTNATIRGWLSQNGENQEQSLRQPLRVKFEIGAPVYDPTRDVMAVPMSFWLNGKLLTPTAQREYPGFENDKGGDTPANLSIWQIRTKRGDWVTIPRKFIIDFCSSTRAVVQGETDNVRFSNLIITRHS
jgi:hypothetical protein